MRITNRRKDSQCAKDVKLIGVNIGIQHHFQIKRPPMSIEEQVEQFKKDYLQHIGVGHLAKQRYYALLRQVVEECCALSQTNGRT